MLERSKFATLRAARRVWAVGAIHGEAERLGALHEALWPRLRHGDRLVYLGNYLGYGAGILGVLDQLLAFRRAFIARPGAFVSDIAFVRGAQEEMWHKLLQLQMALDPSQVLAWMARRGVDATVRAYGGDITAGMAAARSSVVLLTRWTTMLREATRARPGHYDLLNALKRAALTHGGELLFVHAGLDPERPLEAQTDALWWGAGGFARLAEPYGGFRVVVRGFDPARQGMRLGRPTATLDGGCGFGGVLAAACFDLAGEVVDTIEA